MSIPVVPSLYYVSYWCMLPAKTNESLSIERLRSSYVAENPGWKTFY